MRWIAIQFDSTSDWVLLTGFMRGAVDLRKAIAQRLLPSC